MTIMITWQTLLHDHHDHMTNMITWPSWSHDHVCHVTKTLINTVTITTISHVHYVVMFPYVLCVPLCYVLSYSLVSPYALFPYPPPIPFPSLLLSYLFFFVPSRHHTQSNLILATSTLASLPPLCDLNSYLTAGVVVEVTADADVPVEADVTLTADVTLPAPLTLGRASERERSRSMRRRLASVRSSESSMGRVSMSEGESGEWRGKRKGGLR